MRGMDNGSVIEARFLTETVAPVHERMKGTRWNGQTPYGLNTETREPSRSIRDT